MLLSTINNLMALHGLTGNQTVQEYTEEFITSRKIGPRRGMLLCHRTPVTSGPYYLVIRECGQFNKNNKGHVELVSVLE